MSFRSLQRENKEKMSFFIRKGGGGSGGKNSLVGRKRKAVSQHKKAKRKQVGSFLHCCESGIIYFGNDWSSGSSKKFRIQPDPDSQHWILVLYMCLRQSVPDRCLPVFRIPCHFASLDPENDKNVSFAPSSLAGGQN